MSNEQQERGSASELTQLLACPFCGCQMYWYSNNDWHRIRGGHDDDCIFDWEADALMVPATDEAKEEAMAAWNRRANVLLERRLALKRSGRVSRPPRSGS